MDNESLKPVTSIKAATSALLQSMPKPMSESAKRRETPGFVAETETLHDWHALWYLNAHPAFAADYIARNAQDLLSQTIKSKVNIIRQQKDIHEDVNNYLMIGPMYDAINENLGSKDLDSCKTIDSNEDAELVNSVEHDNATEKHRRHSVDPLRQSHFVPNEHVPLPSNSNQNSNSSRKQNCKSNKDFAQLNVLKILTQKPKPPPRMLAALAVGRFAYDVVTIDDEETIKSILPKPFPQKIDHSQRFSDDGSAFKQIKNRIAAAAAAAVNNDEDSNTIPPAMKMTSAPAFNNMLLLYPPAPETMFKPFDCVRTNTDVEMVEENLHEVVFSVCRAIGQMIESEHTSMYVAREDSRGQPYLERRLPFGGMNEKIDIKARNTIASYAADKQCAIAVAEAHQASSIFPLGIGQRNWEVAQSVISVPIVAADAVDKNRRLMGVVEYYRSVNLPPFKAELLKHVSKILCATASCVLATPAFDQDKRVDLLTGLYGPSLASTVEDFDEAVNKLLALGKQIIDAEKSYIYFLLPRESYEVDAPDGARTYAVKTETSKTATGVVHHYFTVSHKVFNYRRRGQGMASALREYAREDIVNKYFDAALRGESEASSTLINFDADYFFHRHRQSSGISGVRPSSRLSSSEAPTHAQRGNSVLLSTAPIVENHNKPGTNSGGELQLLRNTIAETLPHYDDSAIVPGEKRIRSVIIMPIKHMHNSIGCTPCLLSIVNKRHDPNGFSRFDEHVVRKFSLYCGVILSNSTMQYTNSLNRLYLQTTLDEEAFFLTPAVAEAAEFCTAVEKRIASLTKPLRRTNQKSTTKSAAKADEAISMKFQLPFAMARIFYKLFLADKKLVPQLARPQLFNFILSTEKNCQTHTAHHNYYHAVATCQALYVIFRQLPTLWNCYTTIEQYALFFACFCHNLDYLYDSDHIERFHPRIAGLFTCPHDENDQGRELLQILSKAERNDFMLKTFTSEQRNTLLATIKRYESYTDLLHAPAVVRSLEKECIGGDLYNDTDPFVKELLTKLIVIVADLQWTCSPFPQHRQRMRDYVSAWLGKADQLKLYGIQTFDLLGITRPSAVPPANANVKKTNSALKEEEPIFNIKTAPLESIQSIASDMANFLRIYVLPCYQILARIFADMQPWSEAVDANMCAWQLCADNRLDWRVVTLSQLAQFDMQTELRAKRALALQLATMRLDRALDDDQDSVPFVDEIDSSLPSSSTEPTDINVTLPSSTEQQPEAAPVAPAEFGSDFSANAVVNLTSNADSALPTA